MKRSRLFKEVFSKPLRMKRPKRWSVTTRSFVHRSKKAYTRKKKHRYSSLDEW